MSDAAVVLERCARLAAVSEEPGLLVRRYGTPALAEARELVAGWLREAGLEPRVDAVGNLIGRRGPAGAPALVLGSHLDTVRDAGAYDGALGVVAAIAVAERLGELPFALEVVAFADEEGTRFGTAYLGSSAFCGRFDPAWTALRDAEGAALADVLAGDPRDAARAPAELVAYGELHIEQGPVLEAAGAAVGTVTAIAGQTHAAVRFAGAAGPAGTVPMAARRDALAAAAEWVLVVERVARGRDGLVATVGELAVAPGARNVIPGAATLSLDVRHAGDAVRTAAAAALREAAEQVAAARGVAVGWTPRGETPAVAMDAGLADAMVAAGARLRLPSGAGHDAAMLAGLAPAAMLFVRCRGGVSHNPAEHVDEADVAVALDVLERWVEALAAS